MGLRGGFSLKLFDKLNEVADYFIDNLPKRLFQFGVVEGQAEGGEPTFECTHGKVYWYN